MSENYTLEDYQKAGEGIYDKIHLATYPVAIKYIKDFSEIPNEVERPISRNQKMCICQAFTQSRRFSEKLCITAADNFCTPSTLGHGWVNLTEEEYIESQVRQGWHKNPETEAKFIRSQYRKDLKEVIELGYKGVMSAPLTETPFIPDSVLVMGNAVQITYIIHALTFEKIEENNISSTFIGFGESCQKGGFRPFLTQRPEIVFPGTGDRSFCLIQDHEIGIGMTGKQAIYTDKYLFNTGKRLGLKMPLRQVMPRLNEKITPGFMYLRELFDKLQK